MNRAPRSWAAGIVSFALAVLAACWALNWAAELIREALPVLIPVAVVALVGTIAWRWWRTQNRSW